MQDVRQSIINTELSSHLMLHGSYTTCRYRHDSNHEWDEQKKLFDREMFSLCTLVYSTPCAPSDSRYTAEPLLAKCTLLNVN